MTEWNPDDAFDLGIWDDASSTESPPNKKRKSLSLKRKPVDGRFKSPKKDLETYQQRYCPENTKINTRWAVKNFEDWAASHNQRHSDNLCPHGVLLSDNAEELSMWLQRYVLGTRKTNGDKYPPRTLHLLLSGLQRYIRENKDSPFHIFSQDLPPFRKLTNTCDSYYRELREQGVCATTKETEVLTDGDIDRLWACGVLNMHTPQGLLNAVFFYNGMNFLLRGGGEHRALKFSQLSRNVSPEGRVRYTYTENASKNRSGGVAQLDLSHKVVHQFAHPELGERCHVFILDKYFAKIPDSAKVNDIFYVRPLNKAPKSDNTPWFSSVPVGKNHLGKMVKDMCSQAKIEGKKTNHSLRASGITTLFQAGVSEKVIQDRSGHRSLDGLRKYERVSEEQQASACSALVPASSMTQSASQMSVRNTFSPVYQNLQQQQPCCSFSGAHLQNCNINIYQTPPTSQNKQ